MQQAIGQSVQHEAPAIFTPPVLPTTAPGTVRFGALILSLCALALLMVAVELPPSPTGLGTHRQMGFPQCAWMTVAGIPCPTCGMTTSFSHFVRGNWVASFYVQPMGFVLALLTCAVFWLGLYIALTGRPIHRLADQVPMVWVICFFMAFGIAAWGWKIFLELHHIDGWH